MHIDALHVLRSPRTNSRLVIDDVRSRTEDLVREAALVCRKTGRRYPIVDGNPHLFDEEDIIPQLRQDTAKMQSYCSTPPAESTAEGADAGQEREAIYARARRLNTEFMFSALRYRSPHRRRVLEIGANVGDLIARFAALGFEAYALDFFPWEIDRAYRLHVEAGGVPFERVRAPMSRLPFADATFDLVYMHATLHHALPNREADFEWCNPANMHDCLREIARILKPEGALFLLGEGIYPPGTPKQDRHFERDSQAGAIYESWYELAEYESAFEATGCWPHLFVDQAGFVISVHGYDRKRKRRDLITYAQSIGDETYSGFGAAVAVNDRGRVLDKVLPRWIGVEGVRRRRRLRDLVAVGGVVDLVRGRAR